MWSFAPQNILLLNQVLPLAYLPIKSRNPNQWTRHHANTHAKTRKRATEQRAIGKMEELFIAATGERSLFERLPYCGLRGGDAGWYAFNIGRFYNIRGIAGNSDWYDQGWLPTGCICRFVMRTIGVAVTVVVFGRECFEFDLHSSPSTDHFLHLSEIVCHCYVSDNGRRKTKM